MTHNQSEQTIFQILHNMDKFTNQLIIKWNKDFNEGLGISHVLTLSYLSKNKYARPSEIANVLGLKPPTVTTITEKLVKKGFVERLYDDTDRRIIHIKITDSGREILKRANESGQVLRREMFMKLNEKERDELLRLYRKLNNSE
ncbi:MarR family winged helix-turn-helix transcriptional regulator [Phocicoccus schoeneichii]|uniref:MarR family winged helix-turn-helix transcriptional regulator n=1 Tax=Phocicoccus schoeneichii TaxID=1812261 RepID=UPI003D09DDD7